MCDKKPELLVSAGSLDEAERLFKAGADAVNVGHERYALRMPGSLDLEEIQELCSLSREYKGKVYVSVNALLHQEELNGLEDYVSRLGMIGVDAVVFGDPAVLLAARHAAPQMKLHWNTETTSTSYRTVNYWAKRGASRAVLARELSMEEILTVKAYAEAEIQAQVHGMTCIFHSKRDLVTSYMEYQRKADGPDSSQDRASLFLKEDQRDDQRYPVYEDYQGTHVMSAEDLCLIEHLGPLMAHGVDSLKIDGILKSAYYNEHVTAIYRRAVDQLAANPGMKPDPGWLREITGMQPAGRPLGTGFYFKEQIY